MSKLIKKNHHPSKKTIAVKPIDQLMKSKYNGPSNTSKKEVIFDKSSLNEQVSVLKQEIKKLMNKKQSINEEIKLEIAEQKAKWETEKKSYIEMANKQGYEAGFNAGESEGLARYTDLLKQANNIIQSAKNDYDRTIKESEPAIIKLAVHVAEKIILEQLDVDQGIISRIVQDAITDLVDQQEIKIYVSPMDYEYLLQQKKDLENVIDESSKLYIFIDEQLDNGMCLIEYPSGKTDASISTQLDLIESELLNVIMEQD